MIKMRKIIYLTIIVSALLIPSVSVNCQTAAPSGDKYSLLTMPYNQRPLSLYRGQVQVNAGYKFAVRSRSFNNNGDEIILRDKGNSSVLHYYFLDIKYGVTSFMEIGAESYYLRRGIREESATYLSTNALGSVDEINVNTLKEYRGMGDILLFSTLRLPIEYKWVDFGARGGIFLPSSEAEPLKPTHTISNVLAANSYTVNYHYNYKNGYGVPVYFVSALCKFNFSKFAVEGSFSFRDPVKEGTSIRWNQTLVNTAFKYDSKTYKYLHDRTIIIDGSFHYQPVGWFNIYMNSSYYKSSGGWTEYYGNKYSNPVKQLFTLEPGFQIQISPSLTIYQIAGFPLSGKNSDASFFLFTTVSFNIFPF